MADIMQEVTIDALPVSLLLCTSPPPQLQFPRQLPILLHGRVSQSEFEQVLLLAEIPFNQALSNYPNTCCLFIPCVGFCYTMAKMFQLQSAVVQAGLQATNDIAAESARMFEPRGVQFSFVERRIMVGRRTTTEYFIVARVMPEASSTMVDTSLMPPAPYTATPTGEHCEKLQ